MAVIIVKPGRASAEVQQTSSAKRRSGHSRPLTVTVDLHQPGRLRVGHCLTLFSISHSGFYAGINIGRYPKADGRDGVRPYWKTETIRAALSK